MYSTPTEDSISHKPIKKNTREGDQFGMYVCMCVGQPYSQLTII